MPLNESLLNTTAHTTAQLTLPHDALPQPDDPLLATPAWLWPSASAGDPVSALEAFTRALGAALEELAREAQQRYQAAWAEEHLRSQQVQRLVLEPPDSATATPEARQTHYRDREEAQEAWRTAHYLGFKASGYLQGVERSLAAVRRLLDEAAEQARATVAEALAAAEAEGEEAASA